MKSTIVTGSAGFIGSHLSKRLLDDGYFVIGIDDMSSGKAANIAKLKRKYKDNFVFIECSILKTKEYEKFIEHYKPEYIFHNAASKKNICLKDPHKDLLVNGSGTLKLLQLAVKYDVKKFIHASTGSVYGEPVVFPSDESHQLRPTSYYGVSKLAGERYVQMYHDQFELNTTILRYFHVYGSNQENNDKLGGVVSIFAKHLKNKNKITIFGDGEQVRSFTHVDDVVEANIQSMTKGDGEVYNCASGTKTRIYELAEKMAQYYNTGLYIKYEKWMVGDVKEFDVCNKKIKKELGINFKQELNFKGI